MIEPFEPWDLDHADGAGPRTYLGPSHARCNRATAGRGVANPLVNGARVQGSPAPVLRASEHWFDYDPRGRGPWCPCGECFKQYGDTAA